MHCIARSRSSAQEDGGKRCSCFWAMLCKITVQAVWDWKLAHVRLDRGKMRREKGFRLHDDPASLEDALLAEEQAHDPSGVSGRGDPLVY